MHKDDADSRASLLAASRYNIDNVELKAVDLEPEEWERAFGWFDHHPDTYGRFWHVSRALGGIEHKTLSARYEKRVSMATPFGPAPRLGKDVKSLIAMHIRTYQATGSILHNSVCATFGQGSWDRTGNQCFYRRGEQSGRHFLAILTLKSVKLNCSRPLVLFLVKLRFCETLF